MASEVTMPKMGYDMTEGTVLRWLKQPGAAVAKGEVLGEIETGKVNIEIEAFAAGELGAILVPEGATVPVGTPIAVIVAPGEAVPAQYGAGAAGAPAAAATPGAATAVPGAAVAAVATNNHVALVPTGGGAAAPTGDGRVRASPLARRLAGEHGVDLAAVAGSGPGGRVLRDDVLAAVAGRPVGQLAPVAPVAPVAAADRTVAGVVPDGERTPLSRMRQTIARRVVDSWTTAPHIFVTMAIDMGAALALREQVNAHLAATGGGKVSVNDLVVKAVARSLRLEPRLNVSWADGGRVQHDRVHVGVAVALDDGLITLTVADADTKPLSAVAEAAAAMAERARAGRLTPDDVSNPSTFTVSNLGMYGVDAFTAILNPPEAGILAVGAAVPTPVVRDGAVVVRPVMKVTLSADHRVVDGATAAQFLVHLRQTLENPLAMLV
jgi:pyruvate dehydrogenase E2 component (dihydrolipoamide acetyltransferase)